MGKSHGWSYHQWVKPSIKQWENVTWQWIILPFADCPPIGFSSWLPGGVPEGITVSPIKVQYLMVKSSEIHI
jgi:hypothetical protein